MGHDREDNKSLVRAGEKERAREILERLLTKLELRREDFTVDEVRSRFKDPFALLVATILSQNTNDKNSLRAFLSLASKVGVTPERLSSADVADIEDSIRVAGLYRSKARSIKTIARIVLEKFNGRLDEILAKPLEEARELLVSLPGVGLKTADILLLFYAGRPVFPVDTHVNRVSKRLGLVRENAGYEEVRKTLESLFDEEDYLVAHKTFIQHGRVYCRARNPRCPECPVEDLCEWSGKRGKVITE